MKLDIKKLDDGGIEIEGEVEAEVFMSYKQKALDYLGKEAEFPGFRKGKAPANILEANIPPSRLLEEMAEMTLAEHYPKILIDEKIDAIGRPEIMITKIAPNNPLGFKIKTEVMPDIKLPDYKKVAAKASIARSPEGIVISDKELEDAILQIRKMRAHQKMHEDNVAHDNHDHHEIKDEELPTFDDAYVATLGDFKTIDEFKAKLKDNLVAERTAGDVEKNRVAIIEALLKETEMKVPKTFVELELNKMIAKLEDDIMHAGLKLDDYMKQVGKTIEDVRNDFRVDAEKRAKLELIIHEISKIEKIVPSEDAIKAEVDMLISRYKDIDKSRAEAYITQMLTSQKVFELLENSK